MRNDVTMFAKSVIMAELFLRAKMLLNYKNSTHFVISQEALTTDIRPPFLHNVYRTFRGLSSVQTPIPFYIKFLFIHVGHFMS